MTGGPAPLRVVLLTNGDARGLAILARLAERGLSVHAVALRSEAGLADVLRPPGARRLTPRRVLEAPARWAVRRWRLGRVRRRHRRWARRVIYAGRLNSEQMRRSLHQLAPDLLVLSAMGILDPTVIATARLGVLNVHPGLLPWIRGNGAVACAIHRGIAVGASCHYVDPGIDTGPIVARRLLRVPPGPLALRQLSRAAFELEVEMVADAVGDALRTGAPPQAEAQGATRFPLCRWPDRAGREEVGALLGAGRAHALFERWAPLCADRDRLLLPDGPLDAPDAPA